MKRIILLAIAIVFVLSSCASGLQGVVVGKDLANRSVDVRMDDGDIRNVELTLEEFYSGNFEVGMSCKFRCVGARCYPE